MERETKAREHRQLTPGLRLLVATLLLLLVAVVIYFFTRTWDFLGDGTPFNLVFLSAALLLVLGAYVSEPFFTKPADALVNSVAFLIALLGVREKSQFFGYFPAVGLAIALILISIFVIATPRGFMERAKAVGFKIVSAFGRSIVIFPVLYVLILLSFFMERPAEFWTLVTLLIILCGRRPLEQVVLWISSLGRKTESAVGAAIGMVSGRLSPRLVLVHQSQGGNLSVGDVVLLPSRGGRPLLGRSLYNVHRSTGIDSVVQILGEGTEALALGDPLATSDLSRPLLGSVHLPPKEMPLSSLPPIGSAGGETIVGFVGPGSALDSILVEIPESLPPRPELRMGSVVTAFIGDKPYLYQVVEALTVEEKIGLGDGRGFTTFRAQPLGTYDVSDRQLSPPQWIPEIYSPVALRAGTLGRADADAIGVLPNTPLSIPIHSPAELVTHNTAVLGILGIGKSSLTFELIQKVIATTDVRVVVVDITNEYARALGEYTAMPIREDDVHAFDSVNANYSRVIDRDIEGSGNVAEYRDAVKEDLLRFLFASGSASPVIDGSERIRVFNPDYHKVSKGEKLGYNIFTADLSQAEKTRIISEQLFWLLQQMGPTTAGPRALLVLEEAHSLIPEWNATANDGDRAATNGTSKVILQGRKYGMGCLVVTQRTASVSKSILNQCNTVFALRIFDDTGKQFLENYVGRRYADALPTLEERHAIAVGRGLRLKQPVIVRLNEASDVVLPSTP